ncbi:prepilin-type N-terminal cleavage/methylation domain-containing protein [bacterium]|nr:MAG: prepilin-type N-terminal cleavage/methylation domain-containing protein [bacterium]
MMVYNLYHLTKRGGGKQMIKDIIVAGHLNCKNVSAPTSQSSIKSFTLIELIVVIIIVGILAAVGMNQYTKVVEKSRLAEAKIRIGTMRQFAYEYYLENGTVSGITDNNLGVDNICSSTNYYAYYTGDGGTFVDFHARRCTSGGKTPNGSIGYGFYLRWAPPNSEVWHCDVNARPYFGTCEAY